MQKLIVIGALRIFLFLVIAACIASLNAWVGVRRELLLLNGLLGGLGGVAAVDVHLLLRRRRRGMIDDDESTR